MELLFKVGMFVAFLFPLMVLYSGLIVCGVAYPFRALHSLFISKKRESDFFGVWGMWTLVIFFILFHFDFLQIEVVEAVYKNVILKPELILQFITYFILPILLSLFITQALRRLIRN